MPSFAPHRIFVLLALMAGFVLVASGCPGRTIDGLDAGPGGNNPGLISCESADECPDPANYDCVGGTCLQRCAADGVCKPNERCSPRGYCEVGCRDSSTCADGKVCSNGSCISAGDFGSCATKCDCEPGQVCAGGLCQDPPAQCNGPEDCGRGRGDQCEAYLCNGFSKQCFDPDPDPCAGDGDCVGRPGCQRPGDCRCSPNSQCVPSAACTAHDDCGQGFFCNDDLQCDVPPACTAQEGCPSDLVCNVQTSTCEVPRPCAASSECTQAPATHCDTDVGRCVIPTCDNGGRTCQVGQECVNGNCVAPGTGNPCSSDADCPNDPWPNTQFCNFTTISGNGECSVGCRSNASCTGGDVCNASRQCVDGGGTSPGGSGQVGAACSDTFFGSDCAAGLWCHMLLGVCMEICDTPGSCTGGACCQLSGAPECIEGLLFNWCI